MTTKNEFVIVGAGVAGLSLANHLLRRHQPAKVLERSRGVGGRCATRRVLDISLDHGLSFLHGVDAEFQAACQAVPGGAISWPNKVMGDASNAVPQAWQEGAQRFALAGGINTFARTLAAPCDVHLNAKVTGLQTAGTHWQVHLEDGTIYKPSTLVLAVALEQAKDLLQPLLATQPALRAVTEPSVPASTACHALLALYDNAPALGWDLIYPGDSPYVSTISRESSKRDTGAFAALVCHGTVEAARIWPRESHEAAQAALLQELGRILGPWAACPKEVQLHRWGLARRPAGSEQPQPQVIHMPGGARLALCGDAFDMRGGIEGAWASGRALASLLSSIAT